MLIVNFQKPVGNPLFKKFHMFNSGLAPISRYEENEDALARLKPGTIRVDLFMGDRNQELGDLVDGTPDAPVYHFERLDKFAELLRKHGIRPYWCWCYTPLPLQAKGQDFRSVPTDTAVYGSILEALSAHVAGMGFVQHFQEVYNEPDCHGNLFAGTMYDYLPMYGAGARGIKRGDPDAVVGGPAEAFAEPEDSVIKSLDAFLSMTHERKLPLDFFSYHTYGYEENEYVRRTQISRKLLERYGYTQTELHMNELNVLPPLWEYGTTDLTNEKPVPVVWDCISTLLTMHDVTIVHWAQLINSGVDELSLVGLDGIYYPLFYVFEIYARMPVGRYDAAATEALGCMAAKNERRAAFIVWNRSSHAVSDTLQATGAPAGEVTVARLNAAFYNECRKTPHMPLRTDAIGRAANGELELPITLEPCEALYVEVNTDAQARPLSPSLWGRKRYCFANRTSPSYAELELSDQTVYLGRGGDENADPTVSVELLYDVSSLRLETSGDPVMVAVEYGDASGFRPIAAYGGTRWQGVPWLAPLPHSYEESVDRISFNALPRKGGNERVRLTFRLRDSVCNARAEIRLTAED